jgi:hypothetical protein
MKSFSDLYSSRIAKQQVDHHMHMTSDLNPFGDATIHAKFRRMKKIIISTIVG